MRRKNLLSLIYYLIPIPLLFAIALSCTGNQAGSPGPEYRQIVPEVEDENPTPPADLVTVDIERVREQVAANPDDPDARFTYLVSLVGAGIYTEALDQARILGSMGGTNPYRSIAWLNFAQIILNDIAPDDPDRSELVQEAIDGLWIALGWEPESIPAHLALGRLALEAGDDDKALHHLSIVLSVTEIGYELRTEIAKIYKERNENDRARVQLEEALPLAEEAEDRDAVRTINDLLRGLD